MADALMDRIRQDYPMFWYLLSNPEIGPLLRDAVDPNKGFSQNTFFAKVQNTKWWKSQSEAQRTWQAQVHTDPGEARDRRLAMRAAVQQRAAEFGTSLSSKEINFLAENLLQHGQDPNGPELTAALGQLWSGKDSGKGMVAAARTQINQLERDYMTPIRQKGRADILSIRVAQGRDSVEAIQQRMIRQAMALYPHLAGRIKGGETVRQIAAPLQSIVAEELELAGPDAVSLNNPRWKRLLGITDPKSKTTRLPTATEAMRMARAEPQWWKTSHGRESDARMARTLLESFGKATY